MRRSPHAPRRRTARGWAGPSACRGRPGAGSAAASPPTLARMRSKLRAASPISSLRAAAASGGAVASPCRGARRHPPARAKGAVTQRAVCSAAEGKQYRRRACRCPAAATAARAACPRPRRWTATAAPAWPGRFAVGGAQRGEPARAQAEFLAHHVQRGHRRGRAVPWLCGDLARGGIAQRAVRAAPGIVRRVAREQCQVERGERVQFRAEAGRRSAGPKATQPSSPGAFTGTSASWCGQPPPARSRWRCPMLPALTASAAAARPMAACCIPRPCGRAGRNRCPAGPPRGADACAVPLQQRGRRGAVVRQRSGAQRGVGGERRGGVGEHLRPLLER